MQEKATQRADDILDAFLLLAGRYTIDKTTMRDIASHMGVSVGIIYREFEGKEHLIRALLERVGAEFFRMLDRDVAACTSVEEKLYTLTVAFTQRQLRILDEHPSIAEFFMKGNLSVRYLQSNFEQVRLHMTAEHQARLVDVLDEGKRAGLFIIDDVETAAAAIIRAFGWYAFEAYGTGERAFCAGMTEALFSIVHRGLGGVKS